MSELEAVRIFKLRGQKAYHEGHTDIIFGLFLVLTWWTGFYPPPPPLSGRATEKTNFFCGFPYIRPYCVTQKYLQDTN